MILDTYLQELEFASKEDIKKAYGRTKGKDRKKFKQDLIKARKEVEKAKALQGRVRGQLGKTRKELHPVDKRKAFSKATRLHKRSERHLASAEKLYSKRVGQKKVQKIITKPKPQIGRWKWVKPRHKVGAAIVGGAALAGAGYTAYKKYKGRRQEAMIISVNDLRDQIIYEMIQEGDLNEFVSGAIRKLVRRGAGPAKTVVKGGRLARYVAAMGPLGVAFDVMFILDLAHMGYKRFLSKAAKACKGAPDRKMCLRRYEVGAKQAQVRILRSKIGMCSKDKNPMRCKDKVKRKISNLEDDIKFLKQEL